MLTVIINNKILYQGAFVKLVVTNETFGPIEIQSGHSNCMFEIKDKIVIINNDKSKTINIDKAIIKVEQDTIDIVGEMTLIE